MRSKPAWHAEAQALRDQGLTLREIGERFGRSTPTVSKALDPRNAITGVCECGCGGITTVDVSTWKPYRYIFGHQTRSADEALYAVDGNGCWNWTGAIGPTGYGAVNRDGHSIAHRWNYERLVGPIPDGLQLDHLCRNRACVNPAHLEPVIGRENTRRGAGARLTWKDVQAIRTSSARAADLAATYGISETHIHKILSYRAWAAPGQAIDRTRLKLTDGDVRQIREEWESGGVSQSALARQYGVSPRHVSGIVRGLQRKQAA